jgi:hypothetical protein
MDLPVDTALLSYSIQPGDAGAPGAGPWVWTVIDENGRKIVTGLAPNQDLAQTQARNAITHRSPSRP